MDLLQAAIEIPHRRNRQARKMRCARSLPRRQPPLSSPPRPRSSLGLCDTENHALPLRSAAHATAATSLAGGLRVFPAFVFCGARGRSRSRGEGMHVRLLGCWVSRWIYSKLLTRRSNLVGEVQLPWNRNWSANWRTSEGQSAAGNDGETRSRMHVLRSAKLAGGALSLINRRYCGTCLGVSLGFCLGMSARGPSQRPRCVRRPRCGGERAVRPRRLRGEGPSWSRGL